MREIVAAREAKRECEALAADSSSWFQGLYDFLPASLGVLAIGNEAVDEQLDDVDRP